MNNESPSYILKLIKRRIDANLKGLKTGYHGTASLHYTASKECSEVVEGAGAAPQVALGEVVEVDPGVGRVLLALDHSCGGVVRAGVLVLGVAVHYARPDERTSAFGLDLDAQIGEHRLAALLDVREVEKEGEDARTAGEEFLTPEYVITPI